VQETRTLPPITLSIATPASPEEAWRTITDPERIALWFTDASPLGPVGSSYRLDFGDGSVVSGRILRLEPGHVFSHSWSWDENQPEQVTSVTWTVDPAEGGSRISLVHDGWSEAGADAATRADHEAYWFGYLDDLREVLADD
jgi:uncharacterized protein YndB with AHSA1/START domain